MNKIPTIFIRDENDMSRVTRQITPGCEWVLEGLGIPTKKMDGTNIEVTFDVYGNLSNVRKRRNPTREEKAKGEEPGYIDFDYNNPENKHIKAALGSGVLYVNGRMNEYFIYGVTVGTNHYKQIPQGTYSAEALGFKIQGGKDGVPPCLYLFSLWPFVLDDYRLETPTWESLRSYLESEKMEGIVFKNRETGEFAKIKSRDFGIKW